MSDLEEKKRFHAALRSLIGHEAYVKDSHTAGFYRVGYDAVTDKYNLWTYTHSHHGEFSIEDVIHADGTSIVLA